METINFHPVSIICGETGSGKTTQVPQFLYEAGFTSGEKKIGVTEPRRVAAISMANRVSYELFENDDPDHRVAYQVRYDGNQTEHTEILFMTDGVLLKEVKADFLLSKYSVIIIDEAHERSVYSDILIGLLSRIVPQRWKNNDPLRLIIMSATLRVTDFTENHLLFGIGSPLRSLELAKQLEVLESQEEKDETKSQLNTVLPIIDIKARQFDVKKFHMKDTPSDYEYLNVAIRKAGKIHTTLPAGDILIFVSTANECNLIAKRLAELFPKRNLVEKKAEKCSQESKLVDKSKPVQFKQVSLTSFKSLLPLESSIRDDLLEAENDETEPVLQNNGIENDEFEEEESTETIGSTNEPLITLPLYAKLSPEKQQRVFKWKAFHPETNPNPPRRCIGRVCNVSGNLNQRSNHYLQKFPICFLDTDKDVF